MTLKKRNSGHARRRGLSTRRGNIAVLSAVLMVVLLGMVAFAVDVGYMNSTSTELKRTADAAALAGVPLLAESTEAAVATVHEFVQANPVNEVPVAQAQTDIEPGDWDEASKAFTPSNDIPTALRVGVRRDDQALFFARVLGRDSFDAYEESIATYGPRDIMLVLDYSASMNDDSEFQSIPQLGREAVEENLYQIHDELGSPAYGLLPLAPTWFTQRGRTPQNNSEAQVFVTFKDTSVYVTTSKDVSNVVLRFSDGTTQRFEHISGLTGTFAGTGTNTGKEITRCWIKSGTYESGEGPGYGERFEDTAANIKAAYQISPVAFPSNGASWETWINHVKTDSTNNSAGYKKKYGVLNLMNFLLEERPRYNQTPTLWQTSAQPAKAMKNSVEDFLTYLQGLGKDDRIGLSLYNSSSQSALLEASLNNDFAPASQIVQERQAGHYDEYTNVGEGMQKARLELQNNGRTVAQKLMILITDGIANRPTDPETAKTLVRQEASLAAAAKIPIVTIALGEGADTALMQEVAITTGGSLDYYFRVDGSLAPQEMEEALKEMFHKVADDRRWKLVK